tara:strand:- start:31439 stop:31840 length:402 start_codon:yes stop_codon:yes gene_type:complete
MSDGEGRKVPFQNEGSHWFRRLVRELYKESDYFRVVRIRHGFFRVYWKDAYVHELFKEMPYKGYSIYTDNPYKESLKLMQEYEQDGELQRKIKNFVEGYSDARKAIKLRTFQFKNNKEHYDTAKQMYRKVVIK